MGSKVVHTPDGMMIVDENFDESTIDTSSMLPEDPKAPLQPPSGESVSDILVINGEEFRGRIKTYSIYENRKTKQKTIKVILVG